MGRSQLLLRIASLVAAVLLLAGCGGAGGTTSVAPDPVDGSESFDPSPSLEPTGSEEPLPPEQDVSISVPTLPVGGNTDQDGVDQCAHANWLGATLPPGVEVVVDQVALDPDGVFSLGEEPCGSGGPACASSWTWSAETQSQECTVSATQLVDTDQTVTLVLVGTVRCDSTAACDEFSGSEGLFDGSQLGFTAQLGVVATESPSESLSDSPSSDSTGG